MEKKSTSMSDYHIAIIEDDPWYGEILAYHLGLNPDYAISRYHSAKAFLEQGGDVLETARLLDIGKSTIYKMIKKGEVKA